MKNIEISEKDFIDFKENVLKPCLKENKSVFKTIDYSMENFNTLFPRSRIETPLESVKFGKGQFSKFSLRERRNLISAVYETLTKPDIVLQEERPGEFDEPAMSHNYAKNFVMDKDSKMIQSVVVEIEDENVIITSHERPVNEIVSKIKQADQILYIAPEIGSLIRQHTQNEQSVSHQFLGETLQGRTSSLNKFYSYSEEKSIENLLSEGKLTNKDVLRYGETVGIKAVQKVNYVLRRDNKPELDENTFKEATLEELMRCIGDSYGYPEESTNKRKHIAFQTLNRAKVVFEKYSEYITRKVAQEKENEMKKSEQQKMDRMSKELVSSIHNIRENETEDSAYSMNFDDSIFGIKADGTKEYRLNVSFDGEQIKNYSIDCIHIENEILADIDYDIHQNFDESQIKLLEAAKSGISEKIKEYEQKKDISERFDDKSLERLWEELEDVPFKENENGELVLDSSEKWNGFEPGITRDEIWNWFDKHHSKGISYLVNDYAAENHEKRYDAIGSTRSFNREKLVEEAKLNEIVIPPYSREKRDIEIVRDFLARIENLPANQIEDEMVFAIIDNIGKVQTQEPGDFLKIRKDGSLEHISALGSVEKEPIKVLDIIKSFAENHAAVSDEGSQQRKDYEYVVHLQESRRWDFIEKNYPNYETSKAITLSNDIAMWEEGQNDDFKTVEQFNEREGSFFKSREEILEFGNNLDEQLYKTAYAYMNHMETDELEVSEAMAEKIHDEPKSHIVTQSVTFPASFLPEENHENVLAYIKEKYGTGINDYDFFYHKDDEGFDVHFAAPVPAEYQYPKEKTDEWVAFVCKDLRNNFNVNEIELGMDGSERTSKTFGSEQQAKDFILSMSDNFSQISDKDQSVNESKKPQNATALDVMNYLYSNGDTVEQNVADEIIRIFGEKNENLCKNSDGRILLVEGNETKELSPKELCEQTILELDKRLESQNLSYLEKESLEEYKNKLNIFIEENLEKYITVSPDKVHERLVEAGFEISEDCVETIMSEMDSKWAEEIVENSKGEFLWHDKEGEKGFHYDILDVNRLEMLVANTIDSLGDWKERPENKNLSEDKMFKHETMMDSLSRTLNSIKVTARIDNAFEIAKRTVDVKKPFNGKRYSAAEKGIYILEAVKRFSENAPESLNKDFEILLNGKDSIEYGIDSLGFVRPDFEQMKIGMENGWDFEDVCKGYVIAESDELPDGVEVIQRIDDMRVFDSDEAAAVQAQKDGIKVILSYKLSFSDNDPMSYYSYVDSPENRELLKDYILSEEEIALNIEIEWFKDRTESDSSLPEQLKDSAQEFDKANLKKWNNPDRPYSVLFTDDITGNYLLVEVKNSLYSTYLFDRSGKFIEEIRNFKGYREKPNSDIFIDVTSSIEAAIPTMYDYQEHSLWGDFHKFLLNRNEDLKENLIMVKTDLNLYDKKMWQQRREHISDYSEEKYLGHILAESFCTTDFKPEVWSYLLKKGADIDEALKTAAADANLGDNLKWLIENAPEEQWRRIRGNQIFCKEVMDIAEKSITNDEEFSVNPMLSLAEKIGMEAESIQYCNRLIKEYGEKYDLSALKDSVSKFTQKNVYAVASNIYDALADAEKSVCTGKELKELGIAVRFICDISADSEFSADTLRKEFPEVWNDTDILRIQSDFNADGVMQHPVYLIHFDKDMNEVNSLKMDSLSSINNVQLKRNLRDHFSRFVNKSYDMSVREAFDLEPKPGKVFTTDDAKDFAEILNSHRNNSSEPEISEEIAGCIIEYLEYEDYRVYLEKEKGNLCLYDNSEDYTGHGDIQTVKDIVEFAVEMAYKAKELGYDVYSPDSFENLKKLNDAYNRTAFSASLLQATSDEERQSIYMEHYGIPDYAVSRKDNMLTYYIPAKTEEDRYAGYPVKATVNLLSGKESRMSVTEKECHDAHEQYMLENIGRRYISRIKDFLPENERKSVESVLKAGKLAMKDFSDDDKKYINQFMKNLGATDSSSLGKALNKAVTPISEQKKEKFLKGYEERER